MTNDKMSFRSLLQGVFRSPVSWGATTLFVVGVLLGVTLHKGFLILMALGAFGPGVLRQFGLLNDLDEFQAEAAKVAGQRAFLVTGLFLSVITIGRTWSTLSLGDDAAPASTVVALMLVVYYSSYCLSFWDARKAVSFVLTAIGVFWLVFVVLSHGAEPATFAIEALVVPAPIILCGVLCRWWPKSVGVVLIAAALGSIYLFGLLPIESGDAELFLRRAFVFVMIPLPLFISAFALLTAGSDKSDEASNDIAHGAA